MAGKKQTKSTKNYRGSNFESDNADWRLRADPEVRLTPRSNAMKTIETMFSAAASKFWVAIVGFILITLTSLTGIDFTLLGITPESVISFVTAILVYAVRNR